MNPILREQHRFEEEGFENLLLSPRSKTNIHTFFMCCSTCFHSFRNEYVNSAPPKYSFADNFVIGILPDNAWKAENDRSEMLHQ